LFHSLTLVSLTGYQSGIKPPLHGFGGIGRMRRAGFALALCAAFVAGSARAQVSGMPTMVHAGVYGAVTHYLKAIKAAGTAPAESVRPYDYYKLIREIPPEEASRPLNEGNCPLVK
jgi:hypothetical protein